MIPAEEQEFIELWQQGASYRDIAQALGCPLGTVASRSAALAAQGKIQPRQRGGAYPSRRAQARPEDPPATPAPAPADSALPTRDPPAITFMAVPEVRELIHTVKDLVTRVSALEEGTRGDTRAPPHPRAHPRAPAPRGPSSNGPSGCRNPSSRPSRPRPRPRARSPAISLRNCCGPP
jgi:hypothetical protein